MENNVWLILIAVTSYFIGSFPTSYFVAQKMAGKDIRAVGSGNIGAMNTFRVIEAEKSSRVGLVAFLFVLVGDVGKAVLAIFIVRWLSFLQYDLIPAFIICSFFIILGHNYSIVFKFRSGGRGIACLMGILLALDWRSFWVWGGTILVVLFIAEQLLVGKIRWGKIDAVFSIVGSQIVGRVIGMVVALAPIYFLDSRLLFPILAATVLVIIKHMERVRSYMRNLGVVRIGADDIKHGTENTS
jgi:glycerol-3-phosphate acyltransferase PlsY